MHAVRASTAHNVHYGRNDEKQKQKQKKKKKKKKKKKTKVQELLSLRTNPESFGNGDDYGQLVDSPEKHTRGFFT